MLPWGHSATVSVLSLNVIYSAVVTQVNNEGRNYYTITLTSVYCFNSSFVNNQGLETCSFKKMSEIDLMQKTYLAEVEVDTAAPL